VFPVFVSTPAAKKDGKALSNIGLSRKIPEFPVGSLRLAGNFCEFWGEFGDSATKNWKFPCIFRCYVFFRSRILRRV